MTKQELDMLKTFCDIYYQLGKPVDDMWKIYQSMNRSTPMIVDDMLDQVKEQAENIIEMVGIIQNYRPERLDNNIERDTFNTLFGVKQ